MGVWPPMFPGDQYCGFGGGYPLIATGQGESLRGLFLKTMLKYTYTDTQALSLSEDEV